MIYLVTNDIQGGKLLCNRWTIDSLIISYCVTTSIFLWAQLCDSTLSRFSSFSDLAHFVRCRQIFLAVYQLCICSFIELIFVGIGFVFELLWAHVVDPFILTMHGWFSKKKQKGIIKKRGGLWLLPTLPFFPPCWFSIFLPWLTFLVVLPFTNPTSLHPFLDSPLYLYILHSPSSTTCALSLGLLS